MFEIPKGLLIGKKYLVNLNDLKPNSIVRGAILPEPVQVILVTSIGNPTKLIGKGLTSGKVFGPVLTVDVLKENGLYLYG
jgi:hypothetical protein